MVAGTQSGVGKTTIATGLMAALARIRPRAGAVASAKVGPDFIDPGYHSLATGRPGRNLDAWICGEEAMAPLAARAGDGSDILVIEGVMGLFDGVSDPASLRILGHQDESTANADAEHESQRVRGSKISPASTAAVAVAIEAPIVLVVDASSMSSSVAALVHGFDTFDHLVRLAGVILNRVGSDSHLDALLRALEPTGVPVLGALRRDESLRWRDRHLGLVPVIEHPREVTESLSLLADAISQGVDLAAIEQIARGAPTLHPDPLPAARLQGHVRVALASGAAFSFMYPDNIERLQQAGAEIVPFDPINDAALPEEIDGLVAGGGFPETFAEGLAANRPLLEDVCACAGKGLSVWAECGGLLWLSKSLDGHQLCGLINADGTMSERLSLGYRMAKVRRDNPLARAGTFLRGHEFHYSSVEPLGDGLELAGREGVASGGFCGPDLIASYLHLHLGADPSPAERFVARAARTEGPEGPIGTIAG